MTTAKSEPGYAIGTVASLTGLDPHTIRAWERRHGAVAPARSSRGMRRYDDAAIRRLQLLKAVTDCGESIGTVVELSDAELRERLGRLAGMAAGGIEEADFPPASVALLGTGLSAQLDVEVGGLGSLQVTLRDRDLASFLEKLPDSAPQVVVTELRTLGAEPLRRLEQIQDACDPRLLLVVYDFARGIELARVSRTGARLVHGPMRLTQLRHVIDDFLAIEASSPVRRSRPALPVASYTPRLFDDAQLARLLEWRGAVQCECPSHVASLVSTVLAFERYSEECEDRSPEDAALHRHLASESARIRHELEGMLERVCEQEGIRV